jgi:hypothetical protein
MPGRLSRVVLAVAILLAVAACQDPDVGGPCTISWGTDTASPPPSSSGLFASDGADFFESGNLACEDLVCIVSPAAPDTKYALAPYAAPGGGYCSKPCVSNDDCFEKDTGLVCRQMVLDAVFLQQLDAATRDRYLRDVQFSNYCAIPR